MLLPTSLSYLEIAFGYFLLTVTPYIPELILYVARQFGICRYIIHGDKDKFKKIIKRIEKHTNSSSLSYRNGKVHPSGYFIGPNCVGYYMSESRYADEEKVLIITTKCFYEHLAADDDVELVKEVTKKPDSDHEEEHLALIKPLKKQSKEMLNVFIRTGTYKNFYYTKLSIDVEHINPLGAQKEIVDDIVLRYKKKQRLTVFIHGVTLAGKSSIGYLVAKALKGRYTHTFNPTDPGDTFCGMISDINGNNESDNDIDSPIIVVLEEANDILNAIHNNEVKPHKEISTSVRNKATWNGFLDDLVFYKNVVVILTSNEPKDAIDKMDPSYLNSARISATYSMMDPLIIPQDED
jgi:hypothetical protein